jgi:hypothetical protein
MGSDGWKGGPTPAGGHPSAGGDLSKWLERLLFFALFGVFSRSKKGSWRKTGQPMT